MMTQNFPAFYGVKVAVNSVTGSGVGIYFPSSGPVANSQENMEAGMLH